MNQNPATYHPERPSYTAAEAEKLAHSCFGVQTTPKELPSERDQNFHLRAVSGEEYVLKIANAAEQRDILEFQNQAMTHLVKHARSGHFPRVMPDPSGQSIREAESNDVSHFVRLLSFLPGKPLAKVKPHSSELLRNLGRFLGDLTSALQGFSHPATLRDFHWDLKNASWVIRRHMELIAGNERQIIEHVLDQFETRVAPELANLRTSVIHGDTNDYNVLVDRDSENRIQIGLIDFGDMVHSCTVFELAIGCAYATIAKPDPIAAAAAVISGFHAVFPLTDREIEALFTLIRTRLAMSVCLAAYQQQKEPGNAYLSISEQPAWKTLRILQEICPRFAHYAFRQACGLRPRPQTEVLIDWLHENRGATGPVVPVDLKTAQPVFFDLSVSSLDLANPSEFADMQVLSDRLFKKMLAEKVDIGIGRYNEARLCYQGEQFACADDEDGERRTIHIGMDIFMAAGTPILAPLDGKIHSFQNNSIPFDYGPTILLEHTIEEIDVTFFTLYGHLSEDSLTELHAGELVARGQELARLGDISVNGGWPPHLHFQLITDMLDKKGDFPGVVPPSQLGIWRDICPDPNLILQVPNDNRRLEGLSKQEILDGRKKRLGPSLSVSYRRPLQIVRGFMQYLFDEDGQTYLDAVNNVPQVGHSHPTVVEALHKQAAVLNTNTRYLHKNLVRYAERLCARLPDPLQVCFFVNSGSEANELALRLARAHTSRPDVVVVDGAYHGNSAALINISPYKFDGPGGSGRPSYVHQVPMPDLYRGPYKGSDPDAGKKYAAYIREAIERAEQSDRPIGAFICESLLGCGGQIVLPESYLKEAFKQVHEAGGINIIDEVQVGFGRVGSHFWGFETQGVVPDVVTLGKPMGNGHPLGAVITTREIADSFDNGMEYFNTFGGNPVSCAVGMAVLDVLEEEGLQQNAHEVGGYLKAQLQGLKQEHPIVGDVRGMGLFMGIELVSDREGLQPAADQASYIVERMRDHRILISTDGPLHNVIKIKPPLVFTKENADRLVRTLDKILREDFVRLDGHDS